MAGRGTRVTAAGVAMAAALVCTAAAGAGAADDGPREYRRQAGGSFEPTRSASRPRAVTYDEQWVPAGAGVTVSELTDRDGTRVGLRVQGLRPRHTYGAHVHARWCGPRPEDSGPHYQDRRDPHQPSSDVRYANARNEVWLDFTTDDEGNGRASTRVPWRFRADGAHALVLHEHGTETAAGAAGTAGARLACFSVPFGPPRR